MKSKTPAEQPAKLTADDIEMSKRRAGRPKKMQATILDVCSEQDLKHLMRATFVRAMRGEGTSLYWFLTQLPRLDQSFKLPKGLPPLTSLKNLVQAMDVVSEMARLGKLTAADAERALSLINTIASSRMSLLARASEKLDAELRAAIEQERRLEQAPALPVPAWSPGGEAVN